MADSIGKRIATYRRRRGLSQSALAGLVGRSESWVSQVERGVRSVDKMSVLLDLSRVLDTEVQALTGAPWQLAPNGGVRADGLVSIRAVLVGAGWPLSVGITAAATDWLSPHALSEAATAPTATRRRSPDESRASGRPDRVVAFPLTFNTANKIARGVMDNHVAGTLCDALGTGAPIIAALFVNDRLWQHPAWATTLDTLGRAGVVFLDPHTGRLGEPVVVRSGTGGDVVERFDPSWVTAALASPAAATA